VEVIILTVDKVKNTQILVTFPNDLLEQIEHYWHDQKLMNRNEAIRQLIIKGLETEKAQD
jgi:metal-responsive CopG/Arc/MetJ family transcriptional regulator